MKKLSICRDGISEVSFEYVDGEDVNASWHITVDIDELKQWIELVDKHVTITRTKNMRYPLLAQTCSNFIIASPMYGLSFHDHCFAGYEKRGTRHYKVYHTIVKTSRGIQLNEIIEAIKAVLLQNSSFPIILEEQK